MNIETIQAPRGAIAVLSGGKVQITECGCGPGPGHVRPV